MFGLATISAVRCSREILCLRKREEARSSGYGAIDGPYMHDPNRIGYRNVRRVRWEARGLWNYDGNLPTKTLTELTPYRDLVHSLQQLVKGAGPAPEPVLVQRALARYGVEQAMEKFFWSGANWSASWRFGSGRRT